MYMYLGIDINHMDDVGQTLLNWASAFGTLEMVRMTHWQGWGQIHCNCN